MQTVKQLDERLSELKDDASKTLLELFSQVNIDVLPDKLLNKVVELIECPNESDIEQLIGTCGTLMQYK